MGTDLVLSIGLPLTAGVNARQIAAVVAHELGHFTQGATMRLGYVINRIDRWFARLVYERDTWDEALEEWGDSADDYRLGIIVGCAQIAVWFSRQVLKSLVWLGHASSCLLSRQMEFGADRYAIAVVASEGFESMLFRLRELSVLHAVAYPGLEQFWSTKHQVPDSIPDFLTQLEGRMPADFHEQARNTLLNETASLFATHPTDAKRIQKARQNSNPGIFDLEMPASVLFGNFAEAAKTVTQRHYRQNLQLAVTATMLKPARLFLQDSNEVKATGPAITQNLRKDVADSS